jgi:hypothetical protein
MSDKQRGNRDTLARVGLDNPTSVRPILAQAMHRSVPALPSVLRPGVEVSCQRLRARLGPSPGGIAASSCAMNLRRALY